MRSHGTLTRWNDERGFGFISPGGGGAELFVHISAFPRDGVRPTPGELVSYDIEAAADGKPRAVRIQRPAGRTASPRAASPRAASPPAARPRSGPGGRRSGRFAGLVAVGLIGVAAVGWSTLTSPHYGAAADPLPLAAPATAPARYVCDGRTHCSQMSSCSEAEFFLANCPGTQMDGDRDGRPCEQQCR